MKQSPLIAAALMAAAGISGIGSAVEVLARPRSTTSYRSPKAWGRFPGRANPAGTKLVRQAMAGACTLRGRVSNGDWEPQR